MNYHIGDKIKHVRETKGHSVGDLSAHLGLKSNNSVLCIENGDKSPDLNRLGKICYFLDISVIDLIGLQLPEDYSRNTKEKNRSVSLLGQKIAKAREELGHSLDALAEATSISKKILKRLETGSLKKISDKHKIALSDSLSVPLKYLIDEEQPVAEDAY